jgi:EAL domain-containing protein (putative c-di-GMP-specific phosphodiesterase class I)
MGYEFRKMGTRNWTLLLARIASGRTGFWAASVAFGAIGGIASFLIFLAIIPMLNERGLQALDAQLLRRAELAADHALIALGELIEGGTVSCDAPSIAQLRKTIYRYGELKDVRISDPSSGELCSANPETLEANTTSENAGPSLSAANQRISLFPVNQSGGGAMGIRWNYYDSSSLDAIVSTSSLLFDILPQDLRENGTSSLTLSDGRLVANSETEEPTEPARLHRVFLTSKRYPLVASIGVDTDTLAKANREPLLITVVLFSAISFGFGILLCTLAVQSGGPVTEIDAALAKGEFLPFAQPIYSLTSGEMLGVEILARWRRADGTLVPPLQFIPVAEASDRIIALTWHLAKTALRELHDHLSRNRQFKIAFNIAPTQLMSSDFVGKFRQIAVEAGVSPRQIIIEITERQEITDVPKACEVLAKLRDRGFRVAFDDVGTGHNGLSYLHKLGADIIKIDKFLVDSVATSHSAKVLVEMLVNVGRGLHMTTVAEGIETEDQVACLIKCGVDQGQGYLLSRPLPIHGLLDLIRSSASPDHADHRAPPMKAAMIA